MGSKAVPRKIFVLDPILGWADLCMVSCMIYAHGFGRDGFWSMVLDDSACINMYCNIERNIMKIKLVFPVLGSRGKSLCICVLCVMLSHCLFSMFKNLYAGSFCMGLKPTQTTISKTSI